MMLVNHSLVLLKIYLEVDKGIYVVSFPGCASFYANCSRCIVLRKLVTLAIIQYDIHCFYNIFVFIITNKCNLSFIIMFIRFRQLKGPFTFWRIVLFIKLEITYFINYQNALRKHFDFITTIHFAIIYFHKFQWRRCFFNEIYFEILF